MERRRSNGALFAVLVVIAIVVARGAKGKGKPKVLPSGNEEKLVRTSPGSAASWAVSRFGAAVKAVQASGETDAEKARDIALSILTHWSIETGNGVGEWNFNPGNINAYGSQDYVLVKDVDGTTHAQRTFDALADGVSAYVALLRVGRYAGAAAELATNPASSDWFIKLGQEGWFDPTKAKSSWEAARSMYESRRKVLEQYAEV